MSEQVSKKNEELPKKPLRVRLARRGAESLVVWPGLGTLAAFAAPLYWVFDLFTHFRFQYSTVLLAGIVMCALLKHWKALGVGSLMLVINLICVVPLFISTGTPVDTKTKLTVMHFNVHTVNNRYDEVTNYMADSGADIIFIQEIDQTWSLELFTHVEGYELIVTEPRDDNFGIAMLVKKSIKDTMTRARARDVTKAMVPSIEVDVEFDGRTMTFLSVHTTPPISPVCANTRDDQMREVAKWVKQQQERGNAAVVIGDLNATPFSAAFQELTESAELISSQTGFGYQATWPGTRPANGAAQFVLGIPIDHCLHTDELVTADRQVGLSLGSDHRALVVRLAWRE